MTAPSKPELDKRSRNLRRQTFCEFLNIDAFDALSPSDQVRVDKIGALRLEIGDLQVMQLAGRDVNVSRLVEASEQLEQLIHQRAPLEYSTARLEAQRRELEQIISAKIADGVHEALRALRPKLTPELYAELRVAAELNFDPEVAAPVLKDASPLHDKGDDKECEQTSTPAPEPERPRNTAPQVPAPAANGASPWASYMQSRSDFWNNLPGGSALRGGRVP
jgi:hypothetical protein